MSKLLLSGREKLTMGVILILSFAAMWMWFIKPVNYDWVDAGETQATVENIYHNPKLLGPASIKALVKLESGQQVMVYLPLNSHIKKGSLLRFAVKSDRVQTDKRQYSFLSVLK